MSKNDDRPQINLILDAGERGVKTAKLSPDSNRLDNQSSFQQSVNHWLCFPDDLLGIALWSGSLVLAGCIYAGILQSIPRQPLFIVPAVLPVVVCILITVAAVWNGKSHHTAPWLVGFGLFCIGLWLGV